MGLLGCGKWQDKGVGLARLWNSRMKILRRIQGWEVCMLCGGYWYMCYLFRIRKRKDIFMKTNMTGA